MAAWVHRYGWNADAYYRYRKYVMAQAPSYEKSDRDCADLSITLLIEFAAGHGLCVTFMDSKGGIYISKATGLVQGSPGGKYELDDDITVDLKDEFLTTVRKRTSAWDLFYHNSRTNEYGPVPGDLMLRAKAKDDSHAAPESSAPTPGQPAYPVYKDEVGYPNFPGGGDVAMKDYNQTRYFRGDVDADGSRSPASRRPRSTRNGHSNYPGRAEQEAECRAPSTSPTPCQMRADGFDFRVFPVGHRQLARF